MSTTAPLFTPDPDYIDRQLDAELAEPTAPVRETARRRLAREAAEEVTYIVRTALAGVDEALAGVAHITGPGVDPVARDDLRNMLDEAVSNLRAAHELLNLTTT